MKLLNTGYCEAEITIFEAKKEDFKKIQLALKNIWNFGDWSITRGRLFAFGIGFVDEHYMNQQELVEEMASAIWNKTGKYYKIVVDFSRPKSLKPKTVVMDESNFVKLCLEK
jgi:hypothetical protein